jgi:hypothetical protein
MKVRVALLFTLAICPGFGLAEESVPPPAPSSNAVAPPSEGRPPPPPAKAGCFQYGPSGWKEVGCATEEYVRKHYPHLQLQNAIISTPPRGGGGTGSPLVYGVVDLSFRAVGSITDNKFGANFFSIQNNTNIFTGNNGHNAAVQFAVSHQSSESGVCVWNVDVTTQNYNTSCATVSNTRTGGFAAGDDPRIEGRVLPGGLLSVTAYLPWVQSGTSSPIAVNGPDTYGLAANWTTATGAVLGFGNASKLTFSSADIWARIAVSTCQGDTSPTDNPGSSCPGQPQFKPSATVGLNSETQETNNLISLATLPQIIWLNTGLAEIAYPLMVPFSGCQFPNGAPACVAETGSNDDVSETTFTVTCPTPPVPLQILRGEYWAALLHRNIQ